jgi:hypothetical protein
MHNLGGPDVAKIEDDIPDPDDGLTPIDAEELTPLEEMPADALAAVDEAPEAVVATEENPEEPVEAEAEPRKRHSPDLDDELEPAKKPPLLEIVAAIAAPAVALGLAFAGMLSFSTAIFLIALAYIAIMMWLGRKTNTIYTVILGCILAVLVTSVYCLWEVLARYHYDVKAQGARQRVTISRPVDRGVLHS